MKNIKSYLMPTLLCVLALSSQAHSMDQNGVEGASQQSIVVPNEQILNCLDLLSEFLMDMKGRISRYLNANDIGNLSHTNKANYNAIEHSAYRNVSNFYASERFGQVFTVEFSENKQCRLKPRNLLISYLKYHQSHNIFASLKIKNITLEELIIILPYCKNVKNFDLSDNKLTTFPKESNALTEWKKLYFLSKEGIKNQAPRLFLILRRFTQFINFDFIDPYLTILCPEIGHLTKLHTLNLSK